MVAYSFKKRFVEPIGAKTKTQTIRLPRKGEYKVRRGGHALPGEALQLYCGMRTQHCFLIGRAVCMRVIRLTIDLPHSWVDLYEDPGKKPRRLNCWDKAEVELDGFARSDGFETWAAMWDFWEATHGSDYLFDGFLIEWGQSFKPPAVASAP